MSDKLKSGQPDAPKSPVTPTGGKSGQGVWEVYCNVTPYPIRTKNLAKTLHKILPKLEPPHEGVTIHFRSKGKPRDFYYYHLSREGVEKLLNDKPAEAIATLEPPTFRGCKGYLYVTLSPEKLWG